MMHSAGLSVVALAVAAMTALVPSPASAWSNGGYSTDLENPDYGTHDWIADMALTLQTEDVSFLAGTYNVDYLVGTEAPDNPEFIGDGTNHHIYYYSTGHLQDNASAVRASSMYDLALDRLEAGDFSAAAYYIGAMTHYIADVGVFGHTMGTYTDWGDEVHHSDYEEEFEDRLGSLVLSSGIALENMSAYDAALALAHDTTFGEGDVHTNVWMDTNYDWYDGIFEASAMASLHGAVSAVAAAVNHLLIEANYDPPPEPVTPTEPTDLEAYMNDGDVVLIWSPPSDDGNASIIEYVIYRGNTTDGRAKVATVSSTTLTWTDGSAEAGRTYYYWVAARNSAGTGDLSDAVAVILPADDGPDLLIPAAASAVLALLISAGALIWRRSSRRRTS